MLHADLYEIEAQLRRRRDELREQLGAIDRTLERIQSSPAEIEKALELVRTIRDIGL